MKAPSVEVLVLSLSPYRFATRARKAAHAIARQRSTAYISLEAVGRTGVRDRPGHWVSDGVDITQVRVASIKQSGSLRSRVWNLFVAYWPAHRRLARHVLDQPSKFVYVTSPALVGLGLRHRDRYASSLIVDVPERPGSVVARGSLATVFARIERRRLRRAGQRSVLATVAVGEDAPFLRELGFPAVSEVRNAPLESWRAPFHPPMNGDQRPLRGVLIGSLFESRGLEQVIDSLRVVRDRGITVTVSIAGPGRDEYVAALRSRAESVGVADSITWLGPVASHEVSALYLDHDFGFVLYDPSTPGNDGLSNKILECVASGRPVLAGDLPQNRKFVEAHQVGWLASVTADSIADSLAAIEQSREELVDYSRRCRALGDSELTWEAEVLPVLDLVLRDTGSAGDVARSGR